jgi:PleD family two-component response regulator
MEHNLNFIIAQIYARLLQHIENRNSGANETLHLLDAERTIDEVLKLCESALTEHETNAPSYINEIYSKKVMIIDDDPMTLKYLEKSLTKLGYKVTPMDNPHIAFDSLETEQPDLLILDLLMPQMTGFEFLQQIRSQPKYSKLKVIVGTSRSDKEDLAEIFKLGANDYLAKPFNIEALEKTIEENLKIKFS